MAVVDAAPRLPTADDLLRLYRDLCVIRRWLLGRPLTLPSPPGEGLRQRSTYGSVQHR